MKLTLTPCLRQAQTIETPKEYLASLYNDKDRRFTYEIDTNQVLRDCGLTFHDLDENGTLLRNTIYNIEYIVLNSKELLKVKSFFNNEKLAGYYEDITWISSKVPKKYIPFILMNFFVCKYVEFSKIKSKVINVLGIDCEIDDGILKHWSANIFDIVVANNLLDSKEFFDFLTWRKKYEKTDFFDLEIFDEFNQLRKESYNAYKRLTDLGCVVGELKDRLNLQDNLSIILSY